MIDVYGFDNKSNKVKVIEFSDGAINVKVPQIKVKNVSLFVEDSVKDLHVLEQVLDAYPDQDITKIYIPYLPDARADRIFEPGNCLPIRVLANRLAHLGIKEIECADPHSNEVVKMIESNGIKVNVISQKECFKNTVFDEFDYVVAPDKGSTEKAKEIGLYYGVPVIQAEKVRDISTGRIKEVSLKTEFNLEDKRVIIVDDICDGGGTFIPLGEKLKSLGCSSVELYVTHGIFSKGLDIFKDKFDKIHAYNHVGNYVNRFDVMSFNYGD